MTDSTDGVVDNNYQPIKKKYRGLPDLVNDMMMCNRCGGLVVSTAMHDGFHNRLVKKGSS